MNILRPIGPVSTETTPLHGPPESLRRLPSRKRSRQILEDIEDDEEAPCKGGNDLTSAQVLAPLRSRPGAGPTLVILPDLVSEIIRNGTVAPHLARLFLPTHASSWSPKRHMEVEVEVGCTLLPVSLEEPKNGNLHANGQADPPHSSFLMRAFRRVKPGHTSSALNHCLTGPSSLAEWAPPVVLHATKALEACGIHLEGPTIVHQLGKSVTVHAPVVLPLAPDTFFPLLHA